MHSSYMRLWKPLLSALVLAMIVVPLSIAGAKGTAASGGPAKRMAKQLKVLKKQTLALVQRVSALEAQLGQQATPSPVSSTPAPLPPTSLPPNGAAGGDLSGSYPNPQIRPNTILSTDILDNQVTGADIANDSITSADILVGEVGSEDLNSIFESTDVAKGIAVGETGVAIATCPTGSTVISGGGEGSAVGFETIVNARAVNTTGWIFKARNAFGGAKDFTAHAYCLAG